MLHSAPDAETIERLARAALLRLPADFQPYLTDVVIRVEEFADAEQLASVGLSDPRRLVGLYRGHPVDKQSIWASGDLPPTIFVFRQPLLARWRQTGATLEAVVNHLVVHEVGYHFGFSDETMHGLEDEEP
jgi:predicted Zn-dependent protease with MMP-like domain